MASSRAGFSLVELSIVLVILGLLVGGILGGQSLIRAAELRKVHVEYEQWQTAINSFRERFRALPGDFSQAQRFWGEAASCDPELFYDTLDLSQGTCNGNNDGRVGTVVCGATENSPCYEFQTFWQHLARAGIIQGNFDIDGSDDAALATAFPRSGSGIGWWRPLYTGENLTHAFPATRNKNTFLLGLGISNDASNISPEEAWQIDQKIDDGAPHTGVVTVLSGGAFPNCTETAAGAATTVSTTDAQYKLSHSGVACALFFAY